MEQIEANKNKLGETKSLGKRLDSARVARERAQKRLATAEEMLGAEFLSRVLEDMEAEMSGDVRPAGYEDNTAEPEAAAERTSGGEPTSGERKGAAAAEPQEAAQTPPARHWYTFLRCAWTGAEMSFVLSMAVTSKRLARDSLSNMELRFSIV